MLERVYTTSGPSDIFKKRGVIKGIFGDAMADSRPLAHVIASYVNQQLLDEIAAEYAKGRVLLVGTGNLDSLEPVIWNMTAIAASKDPNAIPFRSILARSASIPGAFPPVMIDAEVNGVRHQEMHVDGGTMAQVFFYPPSLNIRETGAAAATHTLHHPQCTDGRRLGQHRARTMSIAARAMGSLQEPRNRGLYRIYTTRTGTESTST